MHVSQEKDWLYVKFYRKFFHPLYELRSRHLRVYYPERQPVPLLSFGHPTLTALFQRVFYGRQYNIQPHVAYTVYCRLESHLIGLQHSFVQVLLAYDQHPCRIRIVCIRLIQFG